MPYRFQGEQLKKKRLKGDFAFHSPNKVVIKWRASDISH